MYDFAERLKTFRKKLGLTQQALADKIGVTKAAISSMERGLTNAPTPEHLFKLSSALHCEPVTLLLGNKVNSSVQETRLAYLTNDESELLGYFAKLPKTKRKILFTFLESLKES